MAAVVLAVGAGGALSGCGNDDAGTGVRVAPSGSAPASAPRSGTGEKTTDTKTLWLGDSIAGVEAPALGAALKAGGVEFKNASSDGGGTVVEGDKMSMPIARSTWKALGRDIASFRPDVIAYQITTYDWGTAQQQRASYEKLAKTARDAGAELVLVSAPPYKVDDFYKKYAGAIKSAPKAAEEVADASGGTVHFYDASALWGTDGAAAKAQRSSDGIHSCQQGSAAFAKWFTERLGKQYGFTPAAPDQWAKDPWVGDRRYAKLGCG
ncbi:SGNH/GDSL hydrolase family protein [Streptomyces aurantiacus]|uniref:SGNH/GDSL hydrolase family protein n=1 Tax=Streptomyces aurantiacus TaxID=47760 RepID=UPI0006E40A11|nr:SGNH/GDSL hydrolase family protein [Streptomyces aurantiacus]